MFELLFLVALASWAVISVLQYLAALPAAPTLMAATILVPALAFLREKWMAKSGKIEFVRRERRRPLPPETFYWPATRRWLGRRTIVAAVIAAASWPFAIAWPARVSPDSASAGGWISATIAIAALAEAAAGLWLYVKTSQRFNRQTPGLVGWLRRGLYRLSDNHEFLAEEPLPREKRAREAVY
jgi:hypothetical protein